MSEYNQYLSYYHTKKTRFWRLVAFVIPLIALLGFGFYQITNNNSDYIAEIAINGMIIDADKQAEQILKLHDDKNVKAVIVAVNSPGGTTYDSEILYNALRTVASKKPVVAYMKNIAASGGYIVALSAEKIFAAKNTITGSIGVLLQVPNAQKLLDNIGVSVLEIKSSPIKGEPNYFAKTPQEAVDNLKSMVDDTNIWFSDLVKERRPDIKPENFSALTNGSVYTGQQAVNNKLIDGIGGKPEAQKYLITQHKLDKKIEIVPVVFDNDDEKSMINQLIGSFSGDLLQIAKNIFQLDIKHIDGLLSLWHS
jgi:protease-4